MANKTEIWPWGQVSAVDRSLVLRKVMEVLAVKGFAKTSIADLTKAAGVDYRTLKKAFGTRQDILRATIRYCADIEASLAHEPLRVSPTGREAILAMLEENVRLRRNRQGSCACLFTLNAFIIPPNDADLQDFLFEKRRTLAKHIRSRLAQSVRAGELAEGTNCEVLANLCVTHLCGLGLRVLDGASTSLLLRSIETFMDALGFRSRRRPPRPGANR
jgi:AcrR family transcriptional regulator